MSERVRLTPWQYLSCVALACRLSVSGWSRRLRRGRLQRTLFETIILHKRVEVWGLKRRQAGREEEQGLVRTVSLK